MAAYWQAREQFFPRPCLARDGATVKFFPQCSQTITTPLRPLGRMVVAEVKVIHADSRDALKSLADSSIDACVTDPPYALVRIQKRFGKPGSKPASGNDAYMRASAGFMNVNWDTGETAFDPEFWREVYRVLKPGAHLVAFSGTRTYHRLACAIEDAGFEIRDMVAWLYGSGFPKSHDVAKGIAKRRVEDEGPQKRVGAWLRAQREARQLRQKDVAALWPSATGGLTGCVANWELGLGFPTPGQWTQLKAFIGFGDELDAEVARLNARKGTRGERWLDAPIVGEIGVASPGFGELRFDGDRSIRDLDAEATAWEGWGTALKPALEPVVFARKPLEGTVAANVLKHGAGALNIDGCRVGTSKSVPASASRTPNNVYGGGIGSLGTGPTGSGFDPNVGRWPANVVHDGSEEVVAAFPDADGGRPVNTRAAGKFAGVYGDFKGQDDGFPGYADSGSAARFFYTAKADAEDRLGSKHPTVKPVDLMAWLCRLVTPPGGVILDPFAGTGTTGIAAMREGFDCILIEREAPYIADIERRLAWARGEGRLTAQEMARGPDKSHDDLPLFGGEAA